tara:strand:+ start:2964 stop:4235 length:1272 start_codon:yes stop_codon:yes gene_type:complete
VITKNKTNILNKTYTMVVLQAIGFLIQMVTNIILARYLSKDSFGELSIFFSLILLLSIPLINPFFDLTIREISSNKKNSRKRKDYLNFLIFSQLLLIFTLSSIVYFFLDYQYTAVIAINLILNVIMFSILSLMTAYQRGANKIFNSQFMFALIFPGLYLLSVIYAINQNILVVNHYLYLRFICGCVAVALFIFFIKTNLKLIFSLPKKSVLLEYFESSFRFLLVTGSGVVAKNFHIILVSVLLSMSLSADFRIATLFSILFIQLFNILGILTQTEFAKKEIFYGNNLKKILVNVYVPLLLISIFSFIFVIIFGTSLIDFIFGLEYKNSVTITIFLCFSYLLPILFGPVSFLLLMNGDEKFVSNVLILSTFINIILSYIFINILGIIGASIGVIISMLLWNIIFTVRCYKRFNKVPNIFYIIKN